MKRLKEYDPSPPYLVRVQIRKAKEKREYFTFFDTTIEEVEEFLREILKNEVNPFADGVRTGIDIREATGAKNGKSKSISFYGLSPKEAAEIIKNNTEK